MFVLPEHRGQGYGTAILEAQKQQAAALGMTIVAGCWHYNHQSRRALERIGMNATSRLLRFSF
jgi:RimJ/RimL family protein N-acetyltransferase